MIPPLHSHLAIDRMLFCITCIALVHTPTQRLAFRAMECDGDTLDAIHTTLARSYLDLEVMLDEFYTVLLRIKLFCHVIAICLVDPDRGHACIVMPCGVCTALGGLCIPRPRMMGHHSLPRKHGVPSAHLTAYACQHLGQHCETFPPGRRNRPGT